MPKYIDTQCFSRSQRMPSNAPISCVVQFIGLRPRSNTADRMPGRSRGATTPQFLRSREILVDVNQHCGAAVRPPLLHITSSQTVLRCSTMVFGGKAFGVRGGDSSRGFGVGVGPLCARSSWKRRSSRSRRSGDSGWVLSGGLLAFLLLLRGVCPRRGSSSAARGRAAHPQQTRRSRSGIGIGSPAAPSAPISGWCPPTEHSSGSTRIHGGLTKTGNGHARRLLVEAARHHRPRYRPGRNLRRRWDAAPLAARTRGEAANQRLHARWAGLDHRRKHPVVANAAIARERAGLVLVVGRPRRLTRPINARMMTRGCRQASGSDPRATYEQSHCGAIDYARPLDKRSTPIRKFRPVVPTRAYQTDTRRYDTLDSQMTATHPTNEAAATTTVAARRFTLPT